MYSYYAVLDKSLPYYKESTSLELAQSGLAISDLHPVICAIGVPFVLNFYPQDTRQVNIHMTTKTETKMYHTEMLRAGIESAPHCEAAGYPVTAPIMQKIFTMSVMCK